MRWRKGSLVFGGILYLVGYRTTASAGSRTSMADVTVYGAPWCSDCRRSKKFLAEQRVAYDWVDIDKEAEGLRTVEELEKGGRTIPTIVFAKGGGPLIDPS